jgi:hypothetical protein
MVFRLTIQTATRFLLRAVFRLSIRIAWRHIAVGGSNGRRCVSEVIVLSTPPSISNLIPVCRLSIVQHLFSIFLLSCEFALYHQSNFLPYQEQSRTNTTSTQ